MGAEIHVKVGRDHPSVPGHFPGNPVIPGVVILGEVLEAIRQTENAAIFPSGIPSVKFTSPLRPDEVLIIYLEARQDHGRVFHCKASGRLVASGQLNYQTVHPETKRQE